MGKELILPKNIRQIGDIQGKEKIFLEDYVMTYIKKKEKQEQEEYLGIFLGERQEREDTVYIFIRGIMEVPEQTEKEQMEKEYQEYFSEWTVQGCCVIGQYPAERMRLLSESLPEAGGLIYHLQDQEETIYRVENGRYRQIKGYFVFYEQNHPMQEYMSSVFSEDRVEKEGVSDKAIRTFRKKVKEKGVQKNTGILKLASSFLVVTVLLAGAVMVNRIGELREMRQMTVSGDTTAENEVVYVEDMEDVSAQNGIFSEGTDAGIAQESAEADGGIVQERTEEDLEQVNVLAGPDSFWEEGTQTETAEIQTAESVPETSATIEQTAAAEQTAAVEQTVALEQTAAVEAASVRPMQAAYVIKEGDTLADICSRYYGNLNRLAEICELNEISDADRIMPGQKIVLP